jgi:hypothetical protein
MCPACMTTLALIAAGATSTDGPTALIVKTYNEPLARRRRPVGRLRDAESAGTKTINWSSHKGWLPRGPQNEEKKQMSMRILSP